jgi:hypothetical protein
MTQQHYYPPRRRTPVQNERHIKASELDVIYELLDQGKVLDND